MYVSLNKIRLLTGLHIPPQNMFRKEERDTTGCNVSGEFLFVWFVHFYMHVCLCYFWILQYCICHWFNVSFQVVVNATQCHHGDLTLCMNEISCNNDTKEVGCEHDVCTCVDKPVGMDCFLLFCRSVTESLFFLSSKQ